MVPKFAKLLSHHYKPSPSFGKELSIEFISSPLLGKCWGEEKENSSPVLGFYRVAI